MSEAIFSFPSLRSKRFRSIGLSAGLKHFSLFERAKIGARAKKCISVAPAPIFAPPKREKCLERAGKPRKRLLRRLLIFLFNLWCG